MKRLLIILTLVSMTGCAHKVPERPASLAARTSLTATRSHIMTATNRANDVGRGLGEARKAIELPTMDKARALLAVRQAEQDSAALIVDLQSAKTQAELADTQVDVLVQDNAKIAAALVASEKQREAEAKAKQRWRLVALGLGAAIALYFGAKYALAVFL